MDRVIIAASISAIGNILAAMLAGIVAALIGTKFLSQQSLKNKRYEAPQDIEYLLTIKKMYCKMHKENGKMFYFKIIRQQASEKGYHWSGKDTPGRVKTLGKG
jgi:hypothetical protein